LQQHINVKISKYTVATLKCPVPDGFWVLIADRGWTRQNGPAIVEQGKAEVARV